MDEFEKNITPCLGIIGKKWLSRSPDMINVLAKE